MPTYLCHGFRWKRRSIRVYVVVQNLDDAAPEWVVKRGSPRSLIESFYNLFDFLPECTFPPTRRSSFAPRSYSQSHSLDRSSVADDDDDDDDDDDADAASHYTARSARGRARSQSRNVVAQQSQSQSQHHQDRDQETPAPPASCRESSNSSRKRSKSDMGRKPLPPTTHAPTGYQAHQAPPSPPSSQSQPQFAGSSYASDSAAADPVLAQDWSPVKVLEEHDPTNLDEVSRPYAYVADYVQRIDASCSIVEEIARYEHMVRASREPAVTGPSSDETLNGKRDTARLGGLAGWFEQLRDQLQRGEEIRWYVVVNGDEEREWPAEGSLSRPETRAQVAHHTQYTHQQLIFEGQDRGLEMRREQLRRDLGYEQGGIDRLADRMMERRLPVVSDKDLPPLRTDVPMHPAGPSRPKTPKTPKTPGKGGFRKLFGRSKTGDQTP
ncbi:putative developmental regulator [Diaporthe ampelina]|uniref:Putative developmental regulator n=1 Tax=Diaporthe ampelina TaxID=1214573 RepID=A0A0G2FIB6_9PEZI|nr:putative developmental regulator [Diaporthe ampelina]